MISNDVFLVCVCMLHLTHGLFGSIDKMYLLWIKCLSIEIGTFSWSYITVMDYYGGQYEFVLIYMGEGTNLLERR